MGKKISLAVITVLIFLAGISIFNSCEEPVSEVGELVSVSGVVRDSATGFGVSGVLVSFGFSDAVSDAEGNYSTIVRLDDSMELSVLTLCDGYNQLSESFPADSASIEHDLILTSIASIYTTEVSGKIIAEGTGTPISGAYVFAGAQGTETAENGTYNVVVEHPGTFTFTVAALGYTHIMDQITTDLAIKDNPDIVMIPVLYTTNISGTVSDTLGNIVPGAWILIDKLYFADENGFYSASITHGGAFSILAWFPGYYLYEGAVLLPSNDPHIENLVLIPKTASAP